MSSRTLLVVSTGDLEQVALEFITERVTGNLEISKEFVSVFAVRHIGTLRQARYPGGVGI